jgi:radical SAM protein with 4Fe4S-binding SPASM domain
MSISSKIDHTVRCPAETLVEAPPPPHAVKIELVRSCNFRCAYCYHSRLDAVTGFMDFALYETILDELRDIGVKEIAPFFYGESFLSPRLAEAITHARVRGFEHIFLTTNGSLATPAKVAECMDAGLNSLKFSLNYCDRNQFEEITHSRPEWFDQIIDNIKYAYWVRESCGYRCGLYASFVLYDDQQRERMKPLLNQVRPYLDEIYALPLYGAPSSIAQQHFWPGNQGRADNPVPPVPCWALFREGHINYDGTVCACSFNTGDHFTVGDLKKQTFMEIWHSEKFKELRRHHLANDVAATACRDCIIGKK